jgi:hypothetical protein
MFIRIFLWSEEDGEQNNIKLAQIKETGRIIWPAA